MQKTVIETTTPNIESQSDLSKNYFLSAIENYDFDIIMSATKGILFSFICKKPKERKNKIHVLILKLYLIANEVFV